MRALSAAEVLWVCERGVRESPVERPLTILTAARPGVSRTSLASLTIGERDSLLLELRERTFGTAISCVAACPGCGEQLDLEFQTGQIRSPFAKNSTGPLCLSHGPYRLQFRIPDTTDLAAVVPCTDVEEARAVLLRRCLIDAFENDRPITAALLPEQTVAALCGEMERIDSQAEVRLALSCAACGRESETVFDIAAFFWNELQTHTRRLLLEVHTLALAYGWSEADILAMSAARRNAYLEMVRQ